MGHVDAVNGVVPKMNAEQHDSVVDAVRAAQKRLGHAVTRKVLAGELDSKQAGISAARLDAILLELLRGRRIHCTERRFWVKQ